MLDIWCFLLQTLTVSGAGAFILLIKALFKDKLSPKWQFAVWGVLGIITVIPAGIFGTYTLFNWQVIVETIKSYFGIYTFSKVLFPIPIIKSIPHTLADWLFVFYALGTLVFAVKYIISYSKLRKILRLGNVPSAEKISRINEIASELNVKIGRITEIEGLPCAFVCGVIQPVLVIPAKNEINEKIILHELFHLKHKDTLFSMIICALKCLHWCNPFIVYCAGRALNDMESRCDQYVLEHLSGEERREYGHILLSMASDRFSKTPGSTCINNGGKNIRARIENIARFKKYPQGMEIVSVCAIILLASSLIIGTKASEIYEFNDFVLFTASQARSIPCSTPAGAFDAYAQSVLQKNGYYRLMCASEDMQESLIKTMLENEENQYPALDVQIKRSSGYFLYNLTKADNQAQEALFVVALAYPPYGEGEKEGMMYLAVQNLRAEKENGRWIAIPLEDFRYVESPAQNLKFGCDALTELRYSGEADNIRIEVTYQTIHSLNVAENNSNEVSYSFSNSENSDLIDEPWFLYDSNYKKKPNPSAKFTSVLAMQSANCYYTGSEDNKGNIKQIALSLAPVYQGMARPSLSDISQSLSEDEKHDINLPAYSNEHHASVTVRGDDLDSEIHMLYISKSFPPTEEHPAPEYYAADLYINCKKVANLDLTFQKGKTP